ncbi:MAG: ATP-binding cassette domain-containing protein, partial [Nocardiopsaceae bacterium]|nr:ATP-binding cassette domain-containing protein [Nocardiopsaceae bacterium]
MLIRHLLARRADLAWLVFWSLVQALPPLASGWSMAQATKSFLAGQVASGLAWLGLYAIAAGAGAIGVRQSYLRVGMLVEPLRDDLVTAVVTGALDRSTAGSAPVADTRSVARLTHQAEIIRDSVAGLLAITSSFALTMISTVVGLVTLVPATLPFVIPPLVASGILLRMLLRPMISRQRTALLAEEEVAEEVSRAVAGVRDITACGAEDRVLAGLTDTIARQAEAARSAARIGAVRTLGLMVGGWLPLVFVLAAAPSMIAGGVSAGAIVGVITYITGSMRVALNTASQVMGAGLVRLYVTYDRIRQTAAWASEPRPTVPRQRHDPDESAVHMPIAMRKALSSRRAPGASGVSEADGVLEAGGAGEIVLRGVRFGYGPHAAPVIDGLSLRIPAGDHLAVAGPSGIGKSSLAGLIAGTLRPDRGDVLRGGIPTTDLETDWRVLIPQQAYVFAGTLEENLVYYRQDGDRPEQAELDTAAEEVGLVPLLSRLGGHGSGGHGSVGSGRGRYDVPVSPAALSAGERQLIALTRAYLSPARIVILDEATCHLDPPAEAMAEQAFAARGGTLIVIAHRVSS